MYFNSLFSFILLLLLLQTVRLTIDLDQYTKLSPCPCDLTSQTCDYHCCCDTACDEDMVKLWDDDNKCLDKKRHYGELFEYDQCQDYTGRALVDDLKHPLMTYWNTIRSFFCIYQNNTEAKDQFIHDTYSIKNSEDFDQLLKDKHIKDKYSISSEISTLTNAQTSSKNYFPGDPILTLGSANNPQGRLLLPMKGAFGKCQYSGVGVKFLVNLDDELCGDRYTISADICNLIPNYLESLNEKIRVIKSDLSNTIAIFTKDAKYYDQFGVFRAGEVGQYAQWNTETNICQNIMEELDMTIYYSKVKDLDRSDNIDSSYHRIYKIHLNLVFRDLPVGKKSIARRIKLKFKGAINAIERSGNPGYLIGKPIRWGIKTTTISGEGDQSVETISFTEKGHSLVIGLKGANPYNDCVINKETLNYKFSHSPEIQFGHDIVISCQLPLTKDELKKFCTDEHNRLVDDKTTQIEMFKYINSITHIAKFGNADDYKMQDWFEIVHTQMAAFTGEPYNAAQRECLSVNNILHFQIYTAKVGIKQYSQKSIINVKSEYKRTTLTYTGTDETQKQNFPFSVIISFSEIDQSTTFHIPEVPNIIPRFAKNSLYPFYYPDD